jgi:hypothetical protein
MLGRSVGRLHVRAPQADSQWYTLWKLPDGVVVRDRILLSAVLQAESGVVPAATPQPVVQHMPAANGVAADSSSRGQQHHHQQQQQQQQQSPQQAAQQQHGQPPPAPPEPAAAGGGWTEATAAAAAAPGFKPVTFRLKL